MIVKDSSGQVSISKKGILNGSLNSEFLLVH